MEILNLTPEILLLLFLVGTVAGFIDALAGGGGLLALPALLLTGMSPLMALGTNKMQGCIGTATSASVMLYKKTVRWADVKWLALSAFIGSLLGTVAVQFVDAAALNILIPIVLLSIALFFIFVPNVGDIDKQPVLSKRVYAAGVIPIIGWYDGMFGPGTGAFFSFAGVGWRGENLILATARAKVMNFATNVAAIIIYASFGQLAVDAGAAMIVGQLIGAWLGAHSLLKIKPRILRIIIVCLCFIMLCKHALQHNWLALL